MKYLKHTIKLRFLSLALAMGMFILTRHARAAEDQTNKSTVPVSSVTPEVLVTAQTDTRKKSYKPENVSSSKYTEPLLDIPQTITVVPQAVIKAQSATTLRETLRNVPGISMQAGEGGVPAGDQMSIRGFSARTDMFVDGVRDFGGYTRDSFNLEQVEVSKGPASSYAGRGSTGGSINQVSKAPSLDRFMSGSVGFGSAFYKRSTVDFNQPLPEIPIPGTALRINGLFHDADTAGRNEVTNKRWGIAPSLALGLETALRVNLSYFYLGQDNVPDYGIPWVPPANATGSLTGLGDQPAPVSWHNFYGLLDRDYEKTQTHLWTAKVEYDATDELTLRNQFRYGRASRDSIVTAPRFANAKNQSINRQVQARDMLDTVIDDQIDATLHFDTGRLEHALVTGLEYIYERSANRPRTGSGEPFADLYNPEPGQSYMDVISISPRENVAVSNSVALSVFDTVKLNEQWEVNGGLRWDYFTTDFQSATGPEGEPLSRIDRKFSWRGGLVYKPLPNGSVYFGYGTSFNPTAEGLTLASTASSQNNLSLDPETTQTYEIGTKWDLFKDRLGVNAALFHTKKNNARTTDPGTSLASTADDVVVVEGDQRVNGIELGMTGNITERWKIFSGYTVLASRILSSKTQSEVGHQLSNTPQQSFSVWSTYQLPFDCEAGLGMQYVDARFNSNANTRKAPEYWLFDAMFAHKLNDHITLRLNAYNLTNQEYIAGVGGGHFIPGAGRSLIAATEFEF